MKKPARRRRTGRVHVDSEFGTHRLRVSAPRNFFGRWTITQAKPRHTAHARVSCDASGRIMVRWERRAQDSQTQAAMMAAVDRTVIAFARGNKLSGACRVQPKKKPTKKKARSRRRR